jgi:hypothetical protein
MKKYILKKEIKRINNIQKLETIYALEGGCEDITLSGNGGCLTILKNDWMHDLLIACCQGWEPMGTIRPGAPADFDYFSHSGQHLSDADAKNLGVAFAKAIDDVQEHHFIRQCLVISPKWKDDRENVLFKIWDGGCFLGQIKPAVLSRLKALRCFCQKGGFEILGE